MNAERISQLENVRQAAAAAALAAGAGLGIHTTLAGTVAEYATVEAALAALFGGAAIAHLAAFAGATKQLRLAAPAPAASEPAPFPTPKTPYTPPASATTWTPAAPPPPTPPAPAPAARQAAPAPAAPQTPPQTPPGSRQPSATATAADAGSIDASLRHGAGSQRQDAIPSAAFIAAIEQALAAGQDPNAGLIAAGQLDDVTAQALRNLGASVQIELDEASSATERAANAARAVAEYAAANGLEAYTVAGRYLLWNPREQRAYAAEFKRPARRRLRWQLGGRR